MQTIDISGSQEIFTVSQLNREVRFLLEGSFPFIWVEGEISNFSAPHSGHWYFCLKDASAQVRVAMFLPQNRKLGFTPKDGMHVFMKARISLYEGRGEFQLIAEFMEETGEGKLQKAFEELKKRLFAAGLFDPRHKKPLPEFPKQIGVVTSATGAAIRDILSVLKRRYPACPVIVYPSLVQGNQAAPALVKALQLANQRNECDLLILSRGGGSLEDLWPFNEEIVAQAIFASNIPIMSGVGHEIDFTIADFVADLRAPTPSAAAELATPDQLELLARLSDNKNHLLKCMQHKLQKIKQHLEWTIKHLKQQHPRRKLLEQAQRLDQAEMTLLRLQNKLIADWQNKLKNRSLKLHALTPLHRIQQLKNRLTLQLHHLINLMNKQFQQNQSSLQHAAARLDGVSPLATLQRGYAIASRQSDQHIIRKASDVTVGEEIVVMLMEGRLNCTVNQKQ